MVSQRLNVEVSCFRDYNSPDNPVNIPLLTWLKSDKYRTKVENIRKETDKDTRDKLKKKLPAVTVSGIFERHANKSLIKHSGLIAIDIDFEGNSHIGNYENLKKEICKISNVAYVGLSVSARGYFAIIPIAYANKHLEHFLALEKAFKKLGLVIDPSCKNVCRLRGYSFDPEPHFNFNAKTFTATYQEPRPVRIYYKSIGDNDAASVESCLNQLSKDITSDYKSWFEIGCSLASGFGESGRGYFHQISRFYESYTVTETDRQFSHCLKGYNKITLGTFFHHCKLAGIEPERNTKNSKSSLVAGTSLGTKQVPSQMDKNSLSHANDKLFTPLESYYETLKDGRQILMHPAGYPLDWDFKKAQA